MCTRCARGSRSCGTIDSTKSQSLRLTGVLHTPVVILVHLYCLCMLGGVLPQHSGLFAVLAAVLKDNAHQQGMMPAKASSDVHGACMYSLGDGASCCVYSARHAIVNMHPYTQQCKPWKPGDIPACTMHAQRLRSCCTR